MIVYKLTDRDMRTKNGFQWAIGEERTVYGDDPDLCTSSWLHCYSSPLLAILLNPMHANIKKPRLFKAISKGRGAHDRGLKSGYKSLTLIKELAVPEVTATQRIAFGILCAKEVSLDPVWNKWADAWLKGKNRSTTRADWIADRAPPGAAHYAAAAMGAVSPIGCANLAVNSAAHDKRLDLKKLALKAMEY